MKMAVVWAVSPCSLVEVYRCFRGACCLHQQGDVRLDDDALMTALKKTCLDLL
jgi:hypothetical protein